MRVDLWGGGGVKMAGMTEIFEPYGKLLERMREVAWVDGASSLLSWDQETFMPAKGLAFRAEQLAHLGGLTHRLFTAPEVGDWIKASEDHGYAAGSKEAANLREWRRTYDRQTRVPASLVEELQHATSVGREAWAVARERSVFKHFQPHLEEILELNRRMADCWGYEESRYDALLEGHGRAGALQVRANQAIGAGRRGIKGRQGEGRAELHQGRAIVDRVAAMSDAMLQLRQRDGRQAHVPDRAGRQAAQGGRGATANQLDSRCWCRASKGS